MARKNTRNTRGKIVNAAWKLFYEQGYEYTTVEEIIDLSGTSKGSFYHYFDGKDALLSTLSNLFDDKYQELIPLLKPEMTAMEQLLFLNDELFGMIENSISLELLTRLYSTQLTTSGEKHLLDHNRIYYRLLRKIISDGQSAGQLTSQSTVSEMAKLYALCERALRLVSLRRGIFPSPVQQTCSSWIFKQLPSLRRRLHCSAKFLLKFKNWFLFKKIYNSYLFYL